MKKLSRTISGVTPVAVMTKPLPCPGKCIYCPTFAATPQSYTPESPAVLRAKSCEYQAYKQVALRLRIIQDMGHPTDKVELIIMGGTFLSADITYQYGFIKDCYDALNGVVAGSLEEAKTINETAQHRCVGLCIETRPDICGKAEIQRMIDFGTTRVELGVQMLDDDIYKMVERGHTVADVAEATCLLREYGLKVHYHWMPGLPGSSPEKDLALSRMVFEDPRFCPDGLKLYPTMVVEGTILEQWWKEGRYTPYPNGTMTGLIADIKALVPPYVRISRVLRDIPAVFISAGLKDSLRDGVRQILESRHQKCRCIRCREYGHRQRKGQTSGEPTLRCLDYPASGGKEIFLSFEDVSDTLYGLLRLRIPCASLSVLDQKYGAKTGLVRELHVYGIELSLGEQGDQSAQHRGLGRKLLAEAECLARDEFGLDSLAILSGVGAREYYRSLGYELVAGYMCKHLD
ncbi:tRNA uridine(34) 5-carboxymethylaminomethyl modification radical SAM/GNAT enzyme Elp3 [Dehalococcoides mccartyi]|uniref:elongator complex protein 3 n=1 Tax=Dehalococcoides mccartyi TaxID=61435 RepID=UPI00098F1D21|nr:tRNA uridine(34) 5-carboxymethylaminomethyl modification radical SAM/GNAT enzyme Elp3 [Dehalococcoides mccartyi]AQU05693.1 tRNA uridine(34) 5-carboxymethylaminomethyl modification radical SAM/GNAT enzyme Elp3 [Dehalococcoides mccartyi]AQU07139.1 tRNA uridine(34) 5-carboxymethylaminomethyl modification radical SAM/GNAT enzyme Elp3 [Dehalococcoides mccartyi]